MRTGSACAIALIALNAFLLPARPTRAQAVGSRVFDGLGVHEAPGHVEVRIRFSVPILYRRHTPLHEGESLHVQLAPLRVSPSQGGSPLLRESLQVPRDLPAPVDSVRFDASLGAEPVIEIRFRYAVRFEVEQGKDLRSLVIRIPVEDLEGRPAGGRGPEFDQRVTALMEEGRRAMTAAQFERAALIYTKIPTARAPGGCDSAWRR
jgi:hypothetical protein